MAGMSSTTILFGVLLTALGVAGYFLTGAVSPTALIPTWFGLPLVALGYVSRSEAMRKHAMHAAATIALVGCGGALFSLMRGPGRSEYRDGNVFAGGHGLADGGVRRAVREVVHRRAARTVRKALTPGFDGTLRARILNLEGWSS